MTAKLNLYLLLVAFGIWECWGGSEGTLSVNHHEDKFSNFVPTSNKVYFASTEALNWIDAKNACTSNGLELVSILTEKEKSSLEFFLRSNDLVPSDKWSGYWTSGIRYPNDTFAWVTTGTSVGKKVYGWLLGEPNHSFSRENCIEMKADRDILGWNDYLCDETRRYLCQVPRKEGPVGQELNDYSFLFEAYQSNDYDY